MSETPGPRPSLLARWVAFPELCAGLVVAALTGLPLAAGLRYLGLDHTRVLLGMQCALRRGLSEGFALDRALGGGSPLLGEPQGGVLYPVNWLLLPFSAELAASLFVVLHLTLAAVAAAYLGRSIRLRPAVASALGIAFGVCGTVVNLVLHGSYLTGAAFLPLVWGGALRLGRGRPRPGPILAIASGVGLLLLGGEFQAAAIACGLVTIEGVRCLWRGRRVPAAARTRRTHRALATVLAVSAGVLLGGPQLAVTAGLSAGSSRGRLLDASEQARWPLGPAEGLATVWPGVASTVTVSGATLGEVLGGRVDPVPAWNDSPYLGLLALAGALAALGLRGRRRFAAIGLLAVLVSLGSSTPVYSTLVTLVPPLGLFRYPAKWLVIASLALLLAAACQWSQVRRSAAARRLGQRLLVAGLVPVVLGLAAVLFHARALDAAADAVVSGVARPELRPALSTVLLQGGGWSLAMGATALLLLRRRPRWLGVLMACDLALAATTLLPLGEPLASLDSPWRSLPSDATLCHGREIGTVRVDPPDHDLGRAANVLPVWLNGQVNTQQCGGAAVPQFYLSSARASVVELFQRIDEARGVVSPALALGCTHLATRGTLPAGLGEALVADPAPVLAPVYRLEQALPEVALASKPRLAHSEEEAIAQVLSARNPLDLLNIIDAPEGGEPRLPTQTGATTARVRFGQGGAARLEFDGTGSAVAVLRRPWWPGFQASQAGLRCAVLRASAALVAVVVADVSRGPVELRYQPPGLGLGVGLGLGGAVLLAGVLVWTSRVRRRRRSESGQ